MDMEKIYSYSIVKVIGNYNTESYSWIFSSVLRCYIVVDVLFLKNETCQGNRDIM